MNFINKYKPLMFLFLGTVLALVPTFLLRINYNLSILFYEKFGTYLGDLWNFFANYITHGLKYPPEYPAGIRIFYNIFALDKVRSLEEFISVNSILLLASALAITYLLYILVKESHGKLSNIWLFWIFAPSLIFYSLYNYDLITILFTILSYFLFTRKKFAFSAIMLAVGVIFKFFPIYLLPIFILNAPKTEKIKYFLLFSLTILFVNLPFMIGDFEAWKYPYIWQITQNISYSMHQQTYWWILYPYFSSYLGYISIGLFAFLYFLFIKKLKTKSMVAQLVTVLILFLLTDRIYSPQYHLYLLPFLVLLPYQINKIAFYLVEIINVAIVFFLFKLFDNLVLLQILVFLRYSFLIILLIDNYKKTNLNYAKNKS